MGRDRPEYKALLIDKSLHQRLATRPDCVLAFEDSATGVMSAQAAGIRVVGVPTLRNQKLPADVAVNITA